MRISSAVTVFGAALIINAALTITAEARFYGDPPDEHHPWAVHDDNRPQPPIVAPGSFSSQQQPGQPPSDAIILFDGKDLSKWQSDDGSAAKWKVIDGGVMQVVPSSGGMRTREVFGDCQLHIEWAAPTEVKGDGQGRGNSGIFLMGMMEIQVLDCYNNKTYADGTAGAVYGLNPPMVNAVRPPGEFQVYDIVFRRPIYKDGKALDPGYVTVFVNGVLVQDHFPLEGPGGHMGRTKAQPFPEKGPLSLQDHGNPMRFRNIWYRQLPPRTVEGSTDGFLSAEAAMAKRQEIAASIREDAAKMQNADNPVPQMLRYMESLVYVNDAAALEKVERLGGQYAGSVASLSSDKLAGKKDEVKSINSQFRWMQKWKLLPGDFGPAVKLQALIKEQGWDKEKK